MIEFRPMPKMHRLSRECIITEKIDGTNASVFIPEPADADKYARKVMAASRTRWIEPGNDNYGFAAWVEQNYEELLKLGPGHHFGEWWGKGIQRGYNQIEKKFSLFNTSRWSDPEVRPKCCDVVPVLYQGIFDTLQVDTWLEELRVGGSIAAPGYPFPEGVVVYHIAGNFCLKKTLDKNDGHKGQ